MYLPYGAYELKARYQRNLLMATTLVALMVGILLAVFYVLGLNAAPTPPPRPPSSDGGKSYPLSSIIVQPQAPQRAGGRSAANTREGIPKPVADTLLPPELDVMIPSNDERGLRFLDVDTGIGGPGIPVDQDPGPPIDYIPDRKEFIDVQIQPEMIHEVKPEYPRMARRIGQEGTVWVQVLLDIDGSVMDAVIAKPTGMTLLEEAALKAAYKNKFSPAIQNHRPVRIWVTYSVHFSLTRDVQ
jgi:protein TonB